MSQSEGVVLENRQRQDQPSLTSAERWVDDHGDFLFRFALSRVHSRDAAEDLVQETFLAALHAQDRFVGGSTERTWLVGILKRKTIDHLRRKYHERPVSDLVANSPSTDNRFDSHGNWRIQPGNWPTSSTSPLEKQEFWTVFSNCLQKLPERLASAFMLREMDGLDGQEVCRILNISANNLWVMLHRARGNLVRCLEINWFGEER